MPQLVQLWAIVRAEKARREGKERQDRGGIAAERVAESNTSSKKDLQVTKKQPNFLQLRLPLA